jgi:hypothetical protein
MNDLYNSLLRMKELMSIREEMTGSSQYDQIVQGDLSVLKEFLLSNNDFSSKLMGLLDVNNMDDLLKKLQYPNKTSIMKVMYSLNQNKDLETYKFLDSILKYNN